MATTLEQDIQAALNRHSAEQDSDTPDFMLAQYLMMCLHAWNATAHKREVWYGRRTEPAQEAATHG